MKPNFIAAAFFVLMSVSGHASVIFQDNFNDNNLDLTKWTPNGNYVSEQNGTLDIYGAVTNAWGSVTSKALPINSSGVISLSEQALLHRSNNYDGSTIGFII